MPEVRIQATDSFPLAASVFGDGSRAVVIINSATAVKRQYYRKFAEFLASQGGTAVTYDYRGIGDSGSEQVGRAFRARMRDWATKDAFSVLEWCHDAYPGRPITVVGHSFGGQCLGLLKNHDRISRVLLVGSQSAYIGNYPARRWLSMVLLWYFAVPLSTRIRGYFPARRFGLGENLPAGVAREWARWCRQRNYLLDDVGPDLPGYFDQFAAPILAYKISDDSYASGRSVDELLAWYRRAPIEVRSITPQDFGVPAIGHFGAFRETFRDTLWQELASWALGVKELKKTGRAPTA